jgi:hypothetical protein
MQHVDWRAPWFAAFREYGERLASRRAAGVPIEDALNLEQGAPLRFVPHSERPQGVAYESHIFETRTCPTRDNLHDLFNGLCWIRFPQAKLRLNALQAAQIAKQGSGVRGPVRDAITVFDENGALLDAPAPLWDALLARDWRALFIDRRALWSEARLVIFGHALLEKLAQPRKEITAHVWSEPCDLSSLAGADQWLAGRLTAERLANKPFAPLPVLGIPGWCSQNGDFSFYDDPLVFRPARRQD